MYSPTYCSLFVVVLLVIIPHMHGYYLYAKLSNFEASYYFHVSLWPLLFFGWTLLFFSRAWFSYPSPSCVATSGNQLQFINIFHESVVFQIEPKSLSVWAPECRVAVMSLESDFTYVNEAIDHTVSFLFLKPIIIDCSVGSWNQMSSPIEIFHLDSLSQVSYCYIQ